MAEFQILFRGVSIIQQDQIMEHLVDNSARPGGTGGMTDVVSDKEFAGGRRFALGSRKPADKFFKCK